MIKIKISLFAIVLFILAGCQETSAPQTAKQTQNQNQKPQAEFVIMALGDSLTEGLGVPEDQNYPALLQKQLHKEGYSNIKVVNAGLSGETSTGLVNRLDWVMQLQPDLTLLNIGANDAMRGLDLDITENNIRHIIKTLRENDSDVILAGMEIYDNLGREYVTGFKDIYPRIAEDLAVPLISFFLQGVAGQPQYNQQDGIHPNQAGYQVIVINNIMPAVTSYMENHKL